MDSSMQVWGEIGFNILYLLAIWWLVLRMWKSRQMIAESRRLAAGSFLGAFFLLALGDSGHVGFRVLAHLSGNLETTIRVFGLEPGLIGLGVLSTSITVTIFYLLLLRARQQRFENSARWPMVVAILLVLVRFALMVPAQNEWNSIVSPQPWSMIRNIPLIGLGTIVAVFFLKDGRQDRLFWKIGWAVVISFAFYIPVILWVEQYPMIGMLMIPKTMAYLAMAWYVYKGWFARRPEQTSSTVSA